MYVPDYPRGANDSITLCMLDIWFTSATIHMVHKGFGLGFACYPLCTITFKDCSELWISLQPLRANYIFMIGRVQINVAKLILPLQSSIHS
jgi:hypothetical protein